MTIYTNALTMENLAERGWQRFLWNGGVIIEYWKPLLAEDEGDDGSDGVPMRRIGVRFNERKDETAPRVYLFTSTSMVWARNCKVLADLDALHRLFYVAEGAGR
jgi:hypothetical protein